MQEVDGVADGLDGVDGRVLVLDAEHVVVADFGEGRAELAPEALVVAVAEGHVVPGALGRGVVGLGSTRYENRANPTTGGWPPIRASRYGPQRGSSSEVRGQIGAYPAASSSSLRSRSDSSSGSASPMTIARPGADGPRST